jgi:beta-lactamase superfamily II metal-dependent hydrolase
VRPSLAIVSSGGRSRNEAQREKVAERYQGLGAGILQTSSDGAIIIESDGNKLRYSGYKSGKKGEIDLNARKAEKRYLTTEITKITK